MRVFLTGATGFIGSAIIPELLSAGHQVLGLTRSDAGAETLKAAGVEPFHGTLEAPETLRAGAAQADAVIHCAFDHDFSDFVAICEKDRRAIEALGDALVGSDRPLVITSGTGMGSRGPGQVATEDYIDLAHPTPRKASEEAGRAVADRGVNVSVIRLPQVHDPYKQGLITPYVQIVREKRVAAYLGEGLNRWPAAHVLDVARLYVLALERAEPGSRYNAVAEEGIPVRQIAEVVARGLKIPAVSVSPEEAPAHLGWLALFAGFDMPASSAITQQTLNWHPTGPTLIEDLEQNRFF
jgi:nucleoside-diphosphate-sugar epimerase